MKDKSRRQILENKKNNEFCLRKWYFSYPKIFSLYNLIFFLGCVLHTIEMEGLSQSLSLDVFPYLMVDLDDLK